MKRTSITSRDLQAQATRERIVTVAVRLIAAEGFDNVTIDDITKEAGIAKGLFYHYFKSKSDIIIETYTTIDADFQKELTQLDNNTSSVDKIIFTVCTQARYAKQRGIDFVKQIYKAQLDTGTAFFIDKQRPFYKTIRDSIAEGQAKGVIQMDIRPDEFARFILSVSRGILYDWCLHDGNYDIEAAMEEYFRKIIFSPKKQVTESHVILHEQTTQSRSFFMQARVKHYFLVDHSQ